MSQPRPPRRRDDLPRRLEEIITPALDKLAGGDEARAYAAWARAVGDPVAGGTHPKGFRRGQLTVECASSVWANELTYLGPQILRRMDEVAPGHPVRRFRFVVGRGFGAAADKGDRARTAAGEEGRTAPAAPRDEPAAASPGQGSGSPAAKKKRRQQPPPPDAAPAAPDALDAARAGAEGVRNGRLRAAIEAALRRSSEGPAGGVGDGTARGPADGPSDALSTGPAQGPAEASEGTPGRSTQSG